MIVVIDDRVFGIPATDFKLYQILEFGLQERHYIQVEPLFESDGERHVNRWLARQPRDIRSLAEQAFENGDEGLAAGPSPLPKLRVRVADVSEPAWDAEVPVLPVDVACRLLELPLRLLVENRRNDSAFLRACAPPALQKRLQEAEERGWVEFVQGGGLNEILFRVREDGRDPLSALRLWVMFDSDARARFDPDTQGPVDAERVDGKFGPSPTSRKVKCACRRARGNLYHHQLRRRAIENYAPGRMLQAWAGGDRARARKVDAFLNDMSDEQRHYFNMKNSRKSRGGFHADAKSGRGISPIYDEELRAHPRLQTGFEGLAELFHQKDFCIEPAWLNDGQMDELGPLIESIFERM